MAALSEKYIIFEIGNHLKIEKLHLLKMNYCQVLRGIIFCSSYFTLGISSDYGAEKQPFLQLNRNKKICFHNFSSGQKRNWTVMANSTIAV